MNRKILESFSETGDHIKIFLDSRKIFLRNLMKIVIIKNVCFSCVFAYISIQVGRKYVLRSKENQ